MSPASISDDPHLDQIFDDFHQKSTFSLSSERSGGRVPPDVPAKSAETCWFHVSRFAAPRWRAIPPDAPAKKCTNMRVSQVPIWKNVEPCHLLACMQKRNKKPAFAALEITKSCLGHRYICLKPRSAGFSEQVVVKVLF